MDQENKGPAETILSSLLAYTDHLYHNRPGIVIADARNRIGVRWDPVTHKVEDGAKVVYRLVKAGKKQQRNRTGVLQEDLSIIENGVKVGDYMPAGIFPQVAKWMYEQVAEVWKLDNEFAARWASYSFGQEHRDLKVVLAAFMLCQSRKGDPERGDNGEILFADEDYRDVGEAMCLIRAKNRDFNPKMILRVRDLLAQDQVAVINRELGFGVSARKPFFGRWSKVVDKWLRHRERNPRILEGLVKQGFRTSVIRLAQKCGYKPDSDRFFQALRWKQAQSKDGRRTMALNMEIEAAECWDGLTEEKICERIVATKPSYKIITSLVPPDVGITRAVMASAIEAGCMSDKDLVIATPTLEDLGLLQVQDVKERWEKAVKSAEDQRAANIAKRVRSREAKDALEEGADTAVKAAVEEVVKGIRVYVIVDISASMDTAIEKAKEYLEKFVQGFPLDQLHVSVFNSVGRKVEIRHASAVGVRTAFRGIRAGGGTNYGAGVMALSGHPPNPDEDALMVFVGDEQGYDFPQDVQRSGLNPMAFGFVKVVGNMEQGYTAVTGTAVHLGIPCFTIDEATFEDPYAIPRTIRALVAATPVGPPRAGVQARERVTLVDTILKTDLLQKPAWAA